MASVTTTSPVSVIVDANVVIALCAEEVDKLANAEAKMKEYSRNGCQFYAPGVLVAECLYVFCRKLQTGDFTAAEHSNAIIAFITMMAAINPPPSGDKSLIKRAEEMRGTLGCSRSADGIYLALAEELNKVARSEVVTFDNGMQSQVTSCSLALTVIVLPTV
jgi:predicted nucleic acid-binding protein